MSLGATEWERSSQVLMPYGTSGIWVPVSWALGVPWERPWPSPWSSVIISTDVSPFWMQATAWPASSPTNSQRPFQAFTLHALIEIGLILFIITLLLNILARFLVWQVARQAHKD